MPRRPRFIHTIRRIRQVAGFPNQREFADYIGISAPLLVSIENGRRALTPELAGRIHWLTGCSLGPLLGGRRDAEPLDDGGRPYTRAHFENHRQLLDYYGERGLLRKRVRALGFWLWTMLRAARLRDLRADQGHGRGFVGRRPRAMLIVAHRIATAIGEVAEEFGLRPEIGRLMRAYGQTKGSAEPESPGAWRRLLVAANKRRASRGKGPMKMGEFQREFRKPSFMVPAWAPRDDVFREALPRWRAELRHMADPQTTPTRGPIRQRQPVRQHHSNP